MNSCRLQLTCDIAVQLGCCPHRCHSTIYGLNIIFLKDIISLKDVKQVRSKTNSQIKTPPPPPVSTLTHTHTLSNH